MTACDPPTALTRTVSARTAVRAGRRLFWPCAVDPVGPCRPPDHAAAGAETSTKRPLTEVKFASPRWCNRSASSWCRSHRSRSAKRLPVAAGSFNQNHYVELRRTDGIVRRIGYDVGAGSTRIRPWPSSNRRAWAT